MANRAEWRALLNTNYTPAQRALGEAYQRVGLDLNPYVSALENALTALPEGTLPTQGVLLSLPEYARLVNATEDVMQRFAVTVERVSVALQNTATESGLAIAESLAGRAVARQWRRASSEAVAQLINFVDSPAMRTRFLRFGSNAAQTISDTILSNFVQGRGALATAQAILEFLDVVPLSWANNMTRTVQVYSYRYANHVAYRANEHLLEGWRWSSARDSKTCLSCWSQEGKVYPVTQTLNDHHQGRCAPIPIVRGSSLTWQTGEQLFNALPADRQLEIMGRGAYEAYRRGDVQFNEFSRPYQDTVYGQMLRRATNRELGITV
jgi:hypothetical protein